jgi:hypothetical protein
MDVAADLKDRFWVVELGLLEKWEAHGLLPDGKTIPDVWTESEHRAMDMLKACRESVDTIPGAPGASRDCPTGKSGRLPIVCCPASHSKIFLFALTPNQI